MKRKLIFPIILAVALIFTVAFAIGASAEDKEPTLEITGANLAFSDRVHVLYAVNTENIGDTDDVELLIFRGEGITAADCVKGNEVKALKSNGNTVDEDGVKGTVFEYTDIAAAEMTEDIYARAAYTKDGVTYYSPVIKYSILQYACNKLGITGTASDNPELRNMLTGMLIYGAAAQEYFDKNLDRLATDAYVKINLEGATFADGLTYGLIKKGETFDVSVPTTSDEPYVLWTDASGKNVGVGENRPIVADGNRTFVAHTKAVEPTFGSYKYVVIVGVDGAGSFYPDDTDTPNIDSIFASGAITRNMRVATPTASSVSWMSLLHGVKPENHKNLENSEVEAGIPYTMNSKYPSILRVVKEARPDDEVAAIYSWIGINGIVEDGAGIFKKQAGDAELTKYIENGYIKSNTPTLLYVHINDPDYVGHTKGHLSEDYFKSLETTDGYIGRIYQAYVDAGIIDDTLFILTSDHGGKDTSHGGLSYNEKNAIFAVSGKNVTNTEIENMYIRDTASIVLHALGIETPETYTSLVPNGIFADVKDQVRVEYHDPDSSRYRIPEATPAVGSKDYITSFVDKTLEVYLPFDGTTDELAQNSTVDEVGKITYEDGYFGKGVQLEDGHLNVHTSFTPGTESFTVSAWAKFATPTNGWSPLIATKTWHGKEAGFSFAAGRYATSAEQTHYGMFEIADGSAISRIEKIFFPSDYIEGWVHVLIIVDKENGAISVSYDFGEPVTLDLSAAMQKASLDSLIDYVVIGDDSTGECAYKSGVAFDELMIFSGAFDEEDKRGLMSYFGLDLPEDNSTPTVADGLDPDVFFTFDEYTKNEGSFVTKVIKHGTPEYVTGKNGGALHLDGTKYFTLDDLKLGTDSYSVATWFRASNLTIEEGNQVIPILSTSPDYDREDLGFNLELKTGTGELWFTMGQGTKGVQQTYRFFCPSTKSEDPAYNIYPSYETFVDRWIHFAVIVDRASKTVSVYMNFEKVFTANLNWYGYGAYAYVEADYAPDNLPLTVGQIGQPNSAVTSKNSFDLDDLMIFKRALTASDIYEMQKFYMNPLSSYIDKTPEISFGFDGTADNAGSSDTPVTGYGSVTYKDGVYGQAGVLGGDNYLTLDGYKLGTDTFTVATWFKTTNLKNESGNQIIPILSTSADYGRSLIGFNLEVRTGTGNVFLTMNDGTTMSNGWAGAMQKDYKFFNPSSAADAGTLPAYSEFENVWIHFALTFDRAAKTVTLYINFEKVMTANIDYYGFGYFMPDEATPDNPDIPLTVGQVGTPNLNVTSKTQIYLDDLMIFRGGLTQDEIAALKEYYNQ